ncbi:MAG: phosphatase PAP2 family protein [Gaiellales bacterium]
MSMIPHTGPLAAGFVQSAPAVKPGGAQLRAGLLSQSSGALAPAGSLPGSPASGAAPMPVQAELSGAAEGAQLIVPREFLAKLQEAVKEGLADTKEFAREHSRSERWMIPDWALLRMKWPPKTDEEDLAFLHDVARNRTPEGVARAQYLSKHGLTDEWERMLTDYTRRVGPSEARTARKLLHDALMMVNTVTQTAKAGAARKRPFIVDPTLPLVVDKPGNNPSYPSGHTTAAFAASMVLAHLMPDRRDEFMGNAFEASWARLYAGVHFPTDVIAGAKLATTVTRHLIDTADAKPKRGTKRGQGINTGIAGTRGSLPGAVRLHGPPIKAA